MSSTVVSGWRWRWFFVAAVLSLAVQSVLILRVGNAPPTVGDAVENQNIAWNLAHGRGYRYDWEAPQWRRPYEVAARRSPRLVQFLRRTGGHPTTSRPPLVPLLGALAIRLVPGRSFLVWRCAEAAIIAGAIGLLVITTRRTFGPVPAGVLLILAAMDPMRLHIAPTEWMTEGVSYAGMAVLIALSLVWLSPQRRTAAAANGLALAMGAVMAWLLLSRSTFLVLTPVVPGVIFSRGWRQWPRALIACGVTAICCAPWWVRNVEVLGSLMPLGTQGAINLPSEYSDAAVRSRGLWAGEPIGSAADAPLHQAATDGKCPPLPPRSQLRGLAWSGVDDPYLAGLFVYATTCGPSIGMEKQLAVICQASARQWIGANIRRLPKLAAEKLWSEVRPKWWLVVPMTLVGLLGFLHHQQRRQRALLLTLLCVSAATIMLTHSVGGRFLVPYLPALQLFAASALTFPGPAGAEV